ncbi:hypothetical protein ACSS6W_000497 [Trichoderma asperelloides]
MLNAAPIHPPPSTPHLQSAALLSVCLVFQSSSLGCVLQATFTCTAALPTHHVPPGRSLCG